MSRPDKRSFQENVLGTEKEDGSVRLFAFTNSRQGYQVVFSPESPLIVLRIKRSAVADQHPCLQWEPLSSLIFAHQPTTTHAVFVLDAAPPAKGPSSYMLSPEQEELAVGASIGGPLKRIGNAMARLNPHNGTFVAAGVSGVVAFKYMLVGEKTLGHRDRLMQHLILVCPGSVDVFQRLGDAVQRRNGAQKDRDDYPLPDVTVLVKPEEQATVGAQWQAWLATASLSTSGTSGTTGTTAARRTSSTLFGQARVVADLSPSLFAAIAREAGVEADGSVIDINKHLETPEVYRIAFALSRATKSIEQYPLLAPLNTPGYENLDATHGHDHAHGDACGHGCGHAHASDHHDQPHTDGDAEESEDGEEDDNEEEEEEDTPAETLVAGLSLLPFCRTPTRIVLEGRVLSLTPGLIGTTEGVVCVSGMDALLAGDAALSRHVQSKLKLGAPVVASTSLVRDARGCTSLHAREMQPMTRMDMKHSVTVGDALSDIPLGYNVSHIAHAYGALLVRGRKCALVRTLAPQGGRKSQASKVASPTTLEAMRMPSALHSDASHNAIECATEALCQGCEVSADNFYFPHYLSPVTYYTPSTSATAPAQCVTLYLALAVNPPPRGPASDAVEDSPEPQEPYDWVSFERAVRLLATEPEREALRALQKSLATAATVGLYQPFKGCGVFGDSVKPLPGDDKRATAASVGAVTATRAPAPVLSAGAAPAAEPALSLQGLSLMVLFCPGVASTEAVQALTTRVLPSQSCFAFNLYTTHAMLQEAVQAHARQQQQQPNAAGDAPFLLHVADDVDVTDFCEARLVPLSEDLGVEVSVFTVLTTDTAARLFPTAAPNAARTPAESEEAAVLLNRLVACVAASDAVVTSASDVPSLPSSVWAALAICAASNPEVALLGGLDARRPLTQVAERAFAATPSASSDVVLHRVQRSTTTPLAPAALHYLTQAESLAALYVSENGGRLRAVPVLVSAEVWIGTRAAQQGHVTLDAENRCLAVTPGTPWESAEDAPRTSHWSLVAHIMGGTAETTEAVAALCAKFEAIASEMMKQVEYNAARDGEDYRTIRDPLPAWNDGWDDDDEEEADACEDGHCGCHTGAPHRH